MCRLSANLLGGLAHGGHAATLRKFFSFSRIEIMAVGAYLPLLKPTLNLPTVLRYALSIFSGNLRSAPQQSIALISASWLSPKLLYQLSLEQQSPVL